MNFWKNIVNYSEISPFTLVSVSEDEGELVHQSKTYHVKKVITSYYQMSLVSTL